MKNVLVMFPDSAWAAARFLLAMSLIGVLFGCDKQPDVPNPPRPVTATGNISTAHMELPARPAPVAPGPM